MILCVQFNAGLQLTLILTPMNWHTKLLVFCNNTHSDPQCLQPLWCYRVRTSFDIKTADPVSGVYPYQRSILIKFSVNFQCLDDAVCARKALNGCDVLGSDVRAIRIGFARVPIKNGQEGSPEEFTNVSVQGISDLNVGASIHALARSVNF